MDLTDKRIINSLQKELPLVSNPFSALAADLEISEQEVLERVKRLESERYISRFGPLYNIERFGGVFLLAAMEIPEERFDEVADYVNSFAEVAHNYRRKNKLNMWFVLAVEEAHELEQVCDKIEEATGLKVYQMPKLKEFCVNLFFDMLADEDA